MFWECSTGRGWLLGAAYALTLSVVAAPGARAEPEVEVEPEIATQTAGELFASAREAFAAGDYARADALFTEFVETYKDEPEVAEALIEIKPLRALAKLRLKKFASALPLVDAALADAKTAPEIVDQLAFWRGLCLMQAQDYRATQVAFGEFYRDRKTRADQRSRCHEALLLFGACDALAGEHAAAAEFLSWQMPRLRRESREAAARATVMLLYSLMRGGDPDAALKFVLEQYEDIASVTQLISFQSLTLQLGADFLERGEYRKAIICLQRVWKRDRLLEHQAQRLADLEAKLEVLRARDLDEFIFQYDGMHRRVASELESFEKVKEFDAALRLRLAGAFQGLGRYREAALVMGDMLQTMPIGETVAGATVTLMQCWMEVRRWPKTVEVAEIFVQRFGEDGGDTGAPFLPTVLFLKGRALHSGAQNDAALAVFRDVYRRFPESGVAGNALFMQGIVLLGLDRNEEAVALFGDMRRELPAHALCEDAFYWQGMGYSFAGEHALSREHLAEYLQTYPSGRYRPDSVFRRAFSIFSLADYAMANAELRAYLDAYPDDRYNDEARLLLGDGLFAIGELDAGIASYQSIHPVSTRFFEDGLFKVGKALKLQRQFGGMREHFIAFVDAYPESRRMAEAVYWTGWAHKAEGDEAAAQEIYWATIEAHGGRPELFGTADLFDGLRKLYPGDARAGYRARLKSLTVDARAANDATLELHAQWAAARSWAPESADRRRCFSRVNALCDPEVHNPRIIADCADYLFATGNHDGADALYAGLRKWHPRAVERDRALLGRARIAKLGGRPGPALELLSQFEQEAPYSSRLADARLLRAGLLVDEGRASEGLEVLASLLENKTLPSAVKAQALFRSAEILAAAGDKMKATAYFERVYVAYGKYRDLVAQSYLRRGELLAEMGRRAQAVEVYRELAGREDLAGFPEFVEAGKYLLEMGEGDDA